MPPPSSATDAVLEASSKTKIMSTYESRRLERIRQNQELLAKLEIQSLVQPSSNDTNDRRPAKKRKILQFTAPSRSSARIAATPNKPDYSDDRNERILASNPSNTSKRQPKSLGSRFPNDESPQNNEQIIPPDEISDIQIGWTNWTSVAAAPLRNPSQDFHFNDYPDFQPNKSPEEMLREGCFGGSYYRPLRSRKLGIVVRDDWEELPEAWIAGLNLERYLTSAEYDPEINKFKVKCGQSIEEWEAAGWISHEHDVRGWFQWYTRFFQGRRCDDDERQVSRWKKCVGETGRWRRMLLKKYMQMGVREVFDDGADEDSVEVSPVMHQTCHHWAFEIRQEHLDAFFNTRGR